MRGAQHSRMAETVTPVLPAQLQIQALMLTGYVTLGRCLNLSEPGFLHLYYLISLTRGLNKSFHLEAEWATSQEYQLFLLRPPHATDEEVTIGHRGVKGSAHGHTAQVAGPQVS